MPDTQTVTYIVEVEQHDSGNYADCIENAIRSVDDAHYRPDSVTARKKGN